VRTLQSERRGRGSVARRNRSRLSSPLWRGVASLLAVAVLMFCYLRVAGTVPVLSDGAGNALEAWQMLHGNLLLHGWWVTDVSFYTTELPQYMVVEVVAGLRPEVVHICAALTYTLLVLLAALVARGRARGAEGVARALLAAGIMLAPEPGGPTWILLSDPDHVGTAVPVLVLLLLLDWARPRWYVPVAAGVLLAWSVVGDPLMIVIGVVPVVAVCLAHAGAGLLRRVPPRALWYEFSLAGAAAIAVPAAMAAEHLLKSLGGYATNRGVSSIGPLSAVPGNIRLTVRSVLSLFGADFTGVRGGLNPAFAAIHLAGVAVVLAAVLLAVWRLVRSLGSRRPDAAAAAGRQGRPYDLVSDLLVAAVICNLAGYLLAFRLRNIYAAHEIGPVLSLGAALAGRQLGGPLVRARLAPALAAGLVCYSVMLGFAASRGQAPPSSVTLAAWLDRHHLRSGLAPYWQAASTTLDADGKIAMGSVVPGRNGKLAPWHWEADLRPFSPAGHTADFLVLVPGGPVTPAQARATFGRPAHVYHYQTYTIMVWHKNLLRELGPAVALSRRPAHRPARGLRPVRDLH
jgi:hypothetical protein